MPPNSKEVYRLHQWHIQGSLPHFPFHSAYVPGRPRRLGGCNPGYPQLYLRHGRCRRLQHLELFRQHADGKHRLRRPRRLGPTLLPALPLGEVIHRNSLLLRWLLLLLPHIPTHEPPETQHNGLLLHFPDIPVLRGVRHGRHRLRAKGCRRQATA